MTNLKTGFYNTLQLKKIYFKSLGENVLISKDINIIGDENISIGNNVRIDNFTNLYVKKIKLILETIVILQIIVLFSEQEGRQ